MGTYRHFERPDSKSMPDVDVLLDIDGAPPSPDYLVPIVSLLFRLDSPDFLSSLLSGGTRVPRPVFPIVVISMLAINQASTDYDNSLIIYRVCPLRQSPFLLSFLLLSLRQTNKPFPSLPPLLAI